MSGSSCLTSDRCRLDRIGPASSQNWNRGRLKADHNGMVMGWETSSHGGRRESKAISCVHFEM